MLDERALGDELLELVVWDEVVVFPVDLARTRVARRVWPRRCNTPGCQRRWDELQNHWLRTRDAEAELVRIVGKETSEERALAHTGGP